MAKIYAKTVTDNQLILSPREGFLRQFSFGLWTELRIAMYIGMVSSSNDNSASGSETVALTTEADRFCFGLKNVSTMSLPGVGVTTGDLFLGISNYNGIASVCASNVLIGQQSSIGYYGTGSASTKVGGVTNIHAGFAVPIDPSVTSAYNGWVGVKFVVSGRGTSAQSFAISAFCLATVTGTDYSANALRTLMLNATYGTVGTVAWNDGAAARVIPDGLFIRCPYYNNRVRISAIRAICVS